MIMKKKYVIIIACAFLAAFVILIYKYVPVLPYVGLEYDKTNLKYILLWTSPDRAPFAYIGGLGQSGFIGRNCSYTNCFVTANRNYFYDYRRFHAVVFAMAEVTSYRSIELPWYRSPDQKYVLASMESSQYYPACSDRFDGYFNWTWSFRLDSDSIYAYIAIRDEHGNVIGPNRTMHWMRGEDMRPVSDEFKNSLRSKTKAAAWFVSNCHSKSNRESFVETLQKELAKYNHTIDVYGDCGTLSCPRAGNQHCLELLKKDYYFYLSFENSFNEDYVTEKLLTALENNAVPIVYGRANYTRFMPDGIYLNAIALGPKRLAQEMVSIMGSREKYADYFRWRNHYSFHSRDDDAQTDDVCAFCELLNDEAKFRTKSVVKDFRKWWDLREC